MSENTSNTNPESNGAAPEVKKLSRRERLVERYNAANAKYTELLGVLTVLADEINTIDALANISTGDEVILTVGAKDATSEVLGTVVGVRDEEDGSKTYKVQYGTGFDSDIAVVKGNKLKLPAVSEPYPEAPAE